MRRKKQNPETCNESCMACKRRFNCKKRILLGYERLAFGNTADAFKLLMGDSPPQGLTEEMDLFNVSEIKKPKDGAMEIKFFDRIKALEHLGDIPDSDNRAEAFYNVLNDCAVQLKKCEDNEV